MTISLEREKYHSIIDAFFETILDLEVNGYTHQEIWPAAVDFLALYTGYQGPAAAEMAVKELAQRVVDRANGEFPTNERDGWKYQWIGTVEDFT